MYKLFLTLRYLRSRRIAYFAIAAVTMCVMMVLIVLSVMGGWLDNVMNRARGMLGDIIVDNQAFDGFPLYQEFIDEIAQWPEIEIATPVIHTFGLYNFRETSQNGTVSVVGLRLEDVYKVNAFRAGLFYEKYYPGTTTLQDQRQPLMGQDYIAEPYRLDHERVLPQPTLPEPYRTALERRRAEALAETGQPLDDPDSADTDLNRLLRKVGGPIIPGVFELAPEDLGSNFPGRAAKLAGDPLPGIIIGRDIMADRDSDGRYERYFGYPKGCRLTLTLWATSGGSVDPVPLKREFRYADDSRTGIYDIDKQYMYVDFELLQALIEFDEAERADGTGKIHARCSQLQIKVTAQAGDNLGPLCARLNDLYQSYRTDERFDLTGREQRLLARVEAKTWRQSQAHIIGPVQKEKILVTILFGVISLIAIFLVLCILYMIVLQKTRDIGIVKSIGGSSTGVATIFLLFGAVVGIVGSGLGTIFGYLFVNNLNEIQDFLISINPAWRVWDLKVYSFDRIPDEINTTDAIVVVSVGIIASTLGALVAAWRAGTMHPVEALRYE